MTKGCGWAMASARAAMRCALVEGLVVGGAGLAREQLGDRLGVAGGLLPDVQMHQVEAEALREPDQVLQGTGGGVGVAVVDERVADQIEVGEKVPVAPVALGQLVVMAAGDARLDPRQVGLQPMGHDGELAPVRLVDVAPQALAHGVEPVVFVRLEAVHELGGGLAQPERMAEHPPQGSDAREIRLQHQLMVHAHRQLRGLRLDEGVAVPVTADPGTKADEARHPNPAIRPVDPPHRPLQLTVDVRHRVEQGLAKEIEPLAHLVGDLGLVHPHLVGLPQDLDLGDDGPEPILQLLFVELLPVQVLGDQEDAPECLGDGAPLGLGRVGGEHRQIDQVLE